MRQVIVGLEAHDGSGKSTTAKEIASLFNGQVFFTKDEMKDKRKPIYSSEVSQKEKMDKIKKTYVQESLDCLQETKARPSSSLIGHGYLIPLRETFKTNLTMTGVSHIILTEPFQMGSLRPDLIFQILIDEQERQARIAKRKEPLSKIDHRLNDEPLYRRALEQERTAYGCITLRLRLRDPESVRT